MKIFITCLEVSEDEGEEEDEDEVEDKVEEFFA